MPADANFYALEDLLDDDRVVEAGTPGFQTEDLVDKIAWRAIPNALITLDGVRVPEANRTDHRDRHCLLPARPRASAPWRTSSRIVSGARACFSDRLGIGRVGRAAR
jgi:alkylation response protein AidB-like acyl-CoA dehydrogenase